VFTIMMAVLMWVLCERAGVVGHLCKCRQPLMPQRRLPLVKPCTGNWTAGGVDRRSARMAGSWLGVYAAVAHPHERSALPMVMDCATVLLYMLVSVFVF
jgi:hypothetical protein